MLSMTDEQRVFDVVTTLDSATQEDEVRMGSRVCIGFRKHCYYISGKEGVMLCLGVS